jgi:hypothetical protein
MGDNRFQGLLSELNTRENSTLALATLASSASLVLLGLVANPSATIGRGFLEKLGMLFPLLGILYREVTIFTIDRADYSDLRAILSDIGFARNKGKLKSTAKLVRRFIVRILLVLPLFIWLTYTVLDFPAYYTPIYFLLGLLVAVPNGLEWSLKDTKEPKEWDVKSEVSVILLFVFFVLLYYVLYYGLL